MIGRTLASQLRQPSGVLGRAVARFMNSTNYHMNHETIEHLAIQPRDHILEIGFGGGAALELIVERAYLGHVSGIDMSETMLIRARRLFREAVGNGRMTLLTGQAEDLPFPNQSFDKVCTVNTIYFWDDPQRAAQEIWRVLKPSGRFVLSFRPLETMRRLAFTRHGFTLYDYDDIDRLLTEAGFADIHFADQEGGSLAFACANARKRTVEE